MLQPSEVWTVIQFGCLSIVPYPLYPVVTLTTEEKKETPDNIPEHEEGSQQTS